MLPRRPTANNTTTALDREMLAKFASRPDGVTIPGLFEGLSPTWAVNAAGRLVDAELVTRSPKGVYRLTPAGWEAFRSGRLNEVPGVPSYNPANARTERDTAPAGRTANSPAANGHRNYRNWRSA